MPKQTSRRADWRLLTYRAMRWLLSSLLILSATALRLRDSRRLGFGFERVRVLAQPRLLTRLNSVMDPRVNVQGEALQPCSFLPKTGYFRAGFCDTCADDTGSHTVCVQCTEQFLQFSKAVGNDLSTAYPEYDFPGLKEGDRWCLCASRWVQALKAGFAPKVVLEATHFRAAEICGLDNLQQHRCNEPLSGNEMQ